MKRSLLHLSIWLAGVASAIPAVAQTYGDRDNFWHPGWGWGHMYFGGLMMIAFWVTLIVLVVLLVRWLSGAGGGTSSALPARRTPLDILQERFAKGEIDRQDYEERKKLLSD
ncbi:MAG: SHOCT domain-containing protein [Rhodospirillales bacterium]|nr:SHOCT domain-containing protein [Rhodospirillales bacterium]